MNKLYGSCSVINVTEDADGMISANYATEMEKDTTLASPIFTEMIMMSASRDLSPQNGEESLRDISEKKNGNQYLSEVLLNK